MLTSEKDVDSLGITLFHGSKRTVCIGNNTVVLAECGTKTNRAGVDNDGGLLVGIEIRKNSVSLERAWIGR